jgi:hypothetical protein
MESDYPLRKKNCQTLPAWNYKALFRCCGRPKNGNVETLGVTAAFFASKFSYM